MFSLRDDIQEIRKIENLFRNKANVNNKQNMTNSNLFRFTFTSEVIEEIDRFAKVHRYDERRAFKDAWTKWLEEPDINTIITEEVQRLTSTGYEGDVLDKLFKSARYYYRKKSDEVKEPVQRKEYVGFSKVFLVSMDVHIKGIMQDGVSPAEAFIKFCTESKPAILTEIQTSKTCNNMNADDLTEKLKKTYKNRHYKLSIRQ